MRYEPGQHLHFLLCFHSQLLIFRGVIDNWEHLRLFCMCCTCALTVFVLQVIESISDWANDKARENPGCVERFDKKNIK